MRTPLFLLLFLAAAMAGCQSAPKVAGLSKDERTWPECAPHVATVNPKPGVPLAHMPGWVRSPYSEIGIYDVHGMRKGRELWCCATGMKFLVP